MQEVAHGPVRRTPGFDGSTEVRVRADLRIVDAVRLGRCAVHQRTSRISFTGSTFGSHPGQYKRATDSVSRTSPPIARRPRRSYGPARRSATAVSKLFVCSRSRSARYDSVRITRSNWLR